MDDLLYRYTGSSPPSETLGPSNPAPYSVGQISPWRLSSPLLPYRTPSPWPFAPLSPPNRNLSTLATGSNNWVPDHGLGASVHERTRTALQEQLYAQHPSSDTAPGPSNVAISPSGSFIIPSSENIASRRSVHMTAELTPLPQLATVNELPPVAPNRARFSRPEWEIHRSHIHKHYLDEDKTLDEVRDIMKEQFNFTPSAKLYKGKFKEWGWSKNIPNEKANWMLTKIQKRRRDENKETKFWISERELTRDRIERSARRGKCLQVEDFEEGRTPNDVKYATPEQASPRTSRPLPSPRTNLNTARVSMEKWLEQAKISIEWGGLTKDEVAEIHGQGHILEDQADWNQAEEKFRDSLAGCLFLLSPTHEYTRQMAYHLANFYFEHVRIADADSLLNWLTESILSRVEMTDEASVQHLLKIPDLLRKWSRIGEAKTFGETMLDTLNRRKQTTFDSAMETSVLRINRLPPIRVFRYMASQQYMTPNGYDDAHDDSQAETFVAFQLSLAWTYIEDEHDGVETFLQALIKQYEEQTNCSNVQNLTARSALATLYHRHGQFERLNETLSGTKSALAKISASDYREKAHVRQVAIEAFRVCFTLEKEEIASSMLNTIESDAADALGADSIRMILLLIENGIWFQEQNRWSFARPRFEQALAAALTNFCPKSPLVQRLEKALNQRHYEEPDGLPCRCFGTLQAGRASRLPRILKPAFPGY